MPFVCAQEFHLVPRSQQLIYRRAAAVVAGIMRQVGFWIIVRRAPGLNIQERPGGHERQDLRPLHGDGFPFFRRQIRAKLFDKAIDPAVAIIQGPVLRLMLLEPG